MSGGSVPELHINRELRIERRHDQLRSSKWQHARSTVSGCGFGAGVGWRARKRRVGDSELWYPSSEASWLPGWGRWGSEFQSKHDLYRRSLPPQQPFPKCLCSPELYVSLKKEKMYPKAACRISECLWELRQGRCFLKSHRFTLHLVCDPSHKTSSSTPQFLHYEMSVIE